MRYKKDELWNLVNPFGNWFNNKGEQANEQAKQAFMQYAVLLERIKPDRKRRMTRDHLGYMLFLVRIYQAVLQRKYERACNELVSLMHYYPYRQQPILEALRDLMRRCMVRMEDKNVVSQKEQKRTGTTSDRTAGV